MTAQEALGLGLQGSIMLTVLGFGLGATFSEANYLFRRPKLLLRCVLSMSVVMPIVFIAVSRTLDLPLEARAALDTIFLLEGSTTWMRLEVRSVTKSIPFPSSTEVIPSP